MAKISVREAIANEALAMSSQALFTSSAFEGEMTRLARNLTGRYDVTRPLSVVCVWDEKEGAFIAYTDGEVINLNAGNTFVRAYRANATKYHILRGLLIHEVGHILCTDFDETMRRGEKITSGGGIPKAAGLTAKEEAAINSANEYLAELKNPTLLVAAVDLLQQVRNIIEDAFVNPEMQKRFPGFAQDIQACLDMTWEDAPTLTQLLAAEAGGRHRFFTVLSMIHFYALFAEFHCESWQTGHEVVQKLGDMLPTIDAAVQERNPKTRIALSDAVFSMLLEYFIPYMEEMIEKYGNDAPERIREELSGAAPKSVAEAASGMRTSSAARAAGESRPEDDGKAAGEADAEGEGEGDAGDAEEEADGAPAVLDEDEVKDVSAEGKHEPGRAAPRKSYSAKKKAEEERGAPVYDKAAEDIERILKKAAEAEATAKHEEAKLLELRDEVDALRHDAIHDGMKCVVERDVVVDDKWRKMYARVADPLEKIADAVAKEVNKILIRRRAGDVQHNLYLGRRLNANALARHDGKVFSRRKLPQRHPTLAVAVRCDESGSMSCGDRITYVRAAAIVLFNFCQKAGVPIAIYGDDETDVVRIRSYAEFDDAGAEREEDKYRLMGIAARHNNRDGYAIRFVAERLKKRQEDVKLLFVISDGAPAAQGYHGRNAIEDMKSVVAEYEKKGVITIAAAIGDDKDAIESIYGSSRFLDIENLEKLPETLVSVLRRFLKA